MNPAPQAGNSEFPYWLIAMIMLGIAAALFIANSDMYRQISATVSKGLLVTIGVTLFSFFAASLAGLLIALAALSNYRWLRQSARFYVEFVRGIPIIVLLFYIAFVGAPALVTLFNWILGPVHRAGWLEPAIVRDFPLLWRAIFALTIGYSAFISEVFRAGILSVEKGQIEAATALGLTGTQRFRFIIFPQAIRTILPPLGNDFIALVKDSSLVSVLGVADVAQMGKLYAAGSFRFMETYNVVAYFYLIMTISLSMALRGLEQHMRQKGQS
ncbi:MAG: amino acid ABC transporter [Hyphomicrobiales bacterium]|nr:MAG: amino acid ABC transporter [Hyphomicrobiales bacterium]